jgi:hypothetical protein
MSVTQVFFTLFILIPFFGFFVLCGIDYILTRSILRLLREIAPEHERFLSAHTGVPIIDRTFWVRPFKFAAFVRENPSFGNPRLERRLAQYERTRRVAIGFAVYFGLLILVLFALFMRR